VTGTWGERPWIMGIVNVTPDSFSGDGIGGDPAALRELARRHIAAGAAILDVGGESTRPGAVPVGLAEELARVLPVIAALAGGDTPISVDTSRAAVAEAALRAGARIVNDVSALADRDLARVAAAHRAWLVVTHNGWTLRDEGSDDIARRVGDALERLTAEAIAAGLPAERVIVDPGLGFGKRPEENLELLRRLPELRARFPRQPLLVGPSRKRFIGQVLGLDVGDRLEGTLACVALAVAAGADIVRVHDVLPAVRVARMARAIAGPTASQDGSGPS